MPKKLPPQHHRQLEQWTAVVMCISILCLAYVFFYYQNAQGPQHLSQGINAEHTPLQDSPYKTKSTYVTPSVKTKTTTTKKHTVRPVTSYVSTKAPSSLVEITVNKPAVLINQPRGAIGKYHKLTATGAVITGEVSLKTTSLFIQDWSDATLKWHKIPISKFKFNYNLKPLLKAGKNRFSVKAENSIGDSAMVQLFYVNPE